MRVTILPDDILQVMWSPADDINRSSISYVLSINTSGANVTTFRNLTYPTNMVTLTELPSTGTVSLQAANPGALSEPVNAAYRMVNITGDGECRYASHVVVLLSVNYYTY